MLHMADRRERTSEGSAAKTYSGGRQLRHGAVTMLPLWTGVVPFGIAFGVLARAAGYSLPETQGFSLFIFAGAAQVASVTLTSQSAGAVAILLTTLLLNLRHVLYGLSLGTVLPERVRPPRPVLAYFLTDEAYGLTIRQYLDGGGGPLFLLGAELSLFLAFNLATLVGGALGSLIPDPSRIGLDFVFPLTFLALLLPLLRTRAGVLVALLSGACALVLSHVVAGGPTVLISTLLAASAGVLLHGRETAP
jgi:4-azaleucine resistance transporter AzlC